MRRVRLHFLSMVPPLLFIIFFGCEQGENINDPEEELNPNIFTYYWDDGWIEHAKWKTTTLGNYLTIRVEAWNYKPQFSSFSVKFDNIIAYWDMDSISLSGGVLDDFDDGIDYAIWNVIISEGAGVYVSNGLLNVDIPEGKPTEGEVEVGGVITKEFMIYGDFDIQDDINEIAAFFANAPSSQ